MIGQAIIAVGLLMLIPPRNLDELLDTSRPETPPQQKAGK